ncbi:trypsin-like peptidase domain-containing protein [Actinoplanes sp. NPDC023801]|uniref:S1C family serine protease n=1 Tax=Actinoplanes sp. NPDC023801 TaxID=3154595 RepID=UPI00340C8936
MTDLTTRPPRNDRNHEPQDPSGRDEAAHSLPPAMPKPRDPRWKRRIAGGAAVLVLVTAGSTTGALLAGNHLTGEPAPAAATTITEDANLAPIVAKVRTGIVTVLVDGARSSSLGSGVVLTADGLILTNNHVVEADGTVSVRLSDGRTVPARVTATDARHDLALVRATGVSGLTPVTFATGDSIAVGDTVLAFGAPLGLEGTVTSGIVSALDRSVDTGGGKLTGLLQTDAAINQGNSGGALVDTAGRVVGINVAIATTGDGGGSVGLGFAIPAGTATAVVNQLRAQL